jgi:glycosyltransferase involved in cell wall biosynthesis
MALPRANKLKVVAGSPNRGVFAAKLEAIACSSGDWVITMDSDNSMPRDTLDLLIAMPKQPDTWYLPSFAMPTFDYRGLCGTWTLENIHEFLERPHAECCINTGNQTVNRHSFMLVFDHLRGAKMSQTLSATDSIQINMHWLYAGGKLACVDGFQYQHRIETGGASNYNRGGAEKLQHADTLLGWLKQTSLDKNK